MKRSKEIFASAVILIVMFAACSSNQPGAEEATAATELAEVSQSARAGGQASVKDDESQKDIVKVAAGSADHSTLIKAIQAAGLVDALANAGPFTVFAPTNEAFNKLPAGTVDDLLKPENLAQLKNVLQYHVTPGVYKAENLKDGQKLGMVNAQNATVSVKDGKLKINGANVVASVRASNGIIHIVDAVLLPQ
ncbi:MAG TPA: fasciclin domain-containing protein [Chitinophagales bacterium]|nr:fasciclin domain-containing protein [Chitinophagales bacterium]